MSNSMKNEAIGNVNDFKETSLAKQQFKFMSEEFPENSFYVTNFKGSEAISELYEFEINFVTKLPDTYEVKVGDSKYITKVLSEELLRYLAVFIIKHPDVLNFVDEASYKQTTVQIAAQTVMQAAMKVALISSEERSLARYKAIYEKAKDSFRDERNSYFYGYPVSCTQGAKVGEWTFYTVRLRPVCDKFNFITQDVVYTNKTVLEIVKNIFNYDKTIPIHYDFSAVDATLPKQEFSFQHNETFFDYISAKLAHDGVYYFYSNNIQLEELVFMNNKSNHQSKYQNITDKNEVKYQAIVSGTEKQKGNIVSSFTESRSSVPAQVFLRDYNWLKPNECVQASATISDAGLGEVYLYGEGFSTESEGKRLAKLRAEEILCQSYHYFGQSASPFFKPGYMFKMTKHTTERLNNTYLVTAASHEGSQESLIASMMGTAIVNPLEDRSFYRNSFQAIPASVAFRPQRKIKRTMINGHITGFVDSAVENKEKVYTDVFGRYKVVFPQTTILNGVLSAACMVRRAQPSVGPKSGTLFPIYPGTEVLVGFTNGHPDKPVILSPVNNTETGFAGHTGSGFSDLDENEIVFNENGCIIRQSGVGEIVTTAKDKLSTYDHQTNIVNGLDSGFATLSKSMSSSYSASLGVDTDSKKLALKLSAASLLSVGQACSAGDAKNHAMDSLGLAFEEAGKLLPLVIKGIKKVKKAQKPQDCSYQATFSNESNASEVSLEAYLDKPAVAMIMASLVAHVATSITQTCMSTSSKTKENKELQKEINEIDERLKKDSNIDKNLKEIDKGITYINKKLLDKDLSAEERASLDEQKTLLESAKEAQKKQRTKLQEERSEKEYEKKSLLAHKIAPNITAIMTEVVAMGMLTYTKIQQNRNARGGIHITSSDNNVAIGAAHEARLTSAKQVFIGANNALNEMTKLQLNTMYNRTDSPVWGNGNPLSADVRIDPRVSANVRIAQQDNTEPRVAIVSKHILSGAEKINRMISLDEITINSLKKISLSTKPDDPIITDSVNLIRLVGPDEISSLFSLPTRYPYTEVKIDNDPAQNAGALFSATSYNAQDVSSSLMFEPSKASINFKEGANKESSLVLDGNATSLSYSAGASDTRKTSVTLSDTVIKAKAGEAEIRVDSSAKNIALLAGHLACCHFDGTSESIRVASKNIDIVARNNMELATNQFTVRVKERTVIKIDDTECKINGKNITLG